jgi:Mn-dependent DtxR family transcriptional regulator
LSIGCKVEHLLSDESGHRLVQFMRFLSSDPITKKASVDSSKPATDRHFKTGHHGRGGRDQWSSTS